MPRITKALAARLARKLDRDDTWNDAREVCDFATGGELDATRLDLLADWTIEARLAARSLSAPRRPRFWLLVHMNATVAELGAVFGFADAETAEMAR